MHLPWTRTRRTYLDWASAAPVSLAARRAFSNALAIAGNPSSPHAEGVAAHTSLEASRTSVARLAGVRATDVVFTSGATESNNLAIRGYLEQLVRQGARLEDLQAFYVPSQHASVVDTLSALRARGIRTEPVPLAGFAVDWTAFAARLTPSTVLVCMDAVCGETGVRFDTREMRRVLDRYERQHGTAIALHVDASQLPLIGSFERTMLGADLLTLDAQKVGGVRGVGVLIRRHGVGLVPLTTGGGQEEGLRPGTEPVASIAACAAALEECASGRESFLARAREMHAEFLQVLTEAVPDLMVNEAEGRAQEVLMAPNILNLSFLGKAARDTDYAVMLMDAAGYAVSTKSACETDEEGSRAVYAYTGDAQRAASTLRISWGPTTTRQELMKAAQELIRTIRFLDAP